MKATKVFVPAKINLTLDVTGKLPNGYHTVRMLMQTVGLHDDVTITQQEGTDMSDWIEFRNAQREDTPLILAFIRELADYEHMLDEVVADEVLLENWIFDKEKAEVLFVLEDGKEVGFALFFHNFSTFLGRGGIYLEDL